MLNFANQRQSIQSSLHKKSEKTKCDYRIRLIASIDVVRFLLRNGLSFRGHDESEDSDYKGLFLELLKFHGVNRPDVEKVILQHAQKNDMMICSTIQKEIVDACTKETIKAIINDLDDMKENSPHDLDKLVVGNLLDKIQEFEFIFVLHLMFKMLLLTNELNKTLQKKDQDIVNAMGLLNLSKGRLQTIRESGLESLMDEVSSFCGKHDILVPEMTEDYPRSKRKKSEISYLLHFRVEVFYAVIDLQLQELNNRFDVVTSDLLLGMASLNPVDSFANFSKSRIMKLVECYKSEFGDNELRDLSYQLDSFIVYARECDSKFLNLKGI
ncbi:hypothetical protein R3W88_023239 [Solanum pinnatisectum]|uniref:DUF4371 domain-containing protein n=1 Tax=Solanum pinnatisectum TaxID=50273 RepID=A0AAV9LWY9_9SOLN|nr:hypothetical protein R3W88_023239 [Solanum pinnatisectum]